MDQYGRALAYVWTSQDSMFNSTLLREGLAQVATFPPNIRYVASRVRAAAFLRCPSTLLKASSMGCIFGE